ncbi:response regulator [Candidatus Magnetomonas plexicatena]|uniref:response regulator n=1 Tax=Candidatus Magnetomonas plexicatena TaxID=2552947 RepID=UPI001C78FFD4|nr:response regulator [Nitrospirales bacterium LBB_01]
MVKQEDKTTNELIDRLTQAHEELKQEKALRQCVDKSLEIHQKKLQSVLDTANDAIITIDSNHNIIYWNRAAEQIFGYTATEALSSDITIIIPEGFRQKHREGVQRVTQTGKSDLIGKTFELLGLRNNGEEFSLELSLAMWKVQGENFYTGIIRDISKRKQTENELLEAKEAAEAANIAKSTFLANMSHEFRTPMNGIIGMTNLALDTLIDKEQREYLTIVKNSSAHLLDLLNDVLDLSKIEAGKMEIKEVDFDLVTTIKTAMDPLAISAMNKGLMFNVEISSNLPGALRGDAGLLRQVLVNLVGNAVKFTDKGTIELKVDLAQTVLNTEPSLNGQPMELYFLVSDTGIGIPEEKLGVIFDSFTMVEEHATKKYEGTGLGLAIVKKIVALLGGEIWVESRVGQGSTFHFTAKFSESSKPVLSVPHVKKNNFGSKRILIVDSNASTNKRLAEMLKSEGFLVDTASSGYEASGILTFSDLQYDIVILDFQLADMDGFAFSKNMKSVEKLSQVKVIMLVEAGLINDDAQCRAYGISGYIAKPIYKSNLMEVLSLLIENWDNPVAPLLTSHSVLQSRRSLSILVADDNVVNQTLAVKLLERRGYVPVVAGNGREAIDILSRSRFDLILMDIQMPVMGGIEATRRIRNSKECELNKDVPIIAMTARALKGDREQFLEAGVSGYISKPVDADELYDLIEKHTLSTDRKPEASMIESYTETPPAAKPIPSQLPAQRTSGVTLDVEKTLRRVKNDEGVLKDMWQAFTEDALRQAAFLKELFEARDVEGLKRQIHLIKGMAANAGATALKSESFRMEMAVKQPNIFQSDDAKIRTFIENIQFETEKAIKEMETYLSKSSIKN